MANPELEQDKVLKEAYDLLISHGKVLLLEAVRASHWERTRALTEALCCVSRLRDSPLIEVSAPDTTTLELSFVAPSAAPRHICVACQRPF